ncbi:cystathionine gamma-synthase [Citricoccus sp. NR2]|uniref:cystathionine gamma-synthase n=1 Tax=Citricoccus sp. NR2 TaxID=3004095 RepID=UPI0022DD92B4|nr:cystathionine gamma-synthase [Citricoccus sp. NR2]WBL19534.1 cystathionine gamma-synthase [Citricoccus sp. NR2]
MCPKPFPHFATAAIHAGQEPDPLTGAVIPPIYQTSTFTQHGVETLKAGYEYSRGANPTRTALEQQLAALEHGDAGFAFASGIAAEDALLRATLRPGDTVIAAAESYGGTHRLLTQIYARWGVNTVFVSPHDTAALEQALNSHRARIVWLETPTNPLLSIIDIRAWSEISHAHGALVVVDNTFASPALQTPLDLGADAVVHSTTKYIGGHSDVLGGAVITSTAFWEDQPLTELIRFQQFAGGAVAGPQDCFLTSRGLKTLAVRMRQHSDNAAVVAGWLTEQPQVAEVYYPGLEQHPGHSIAAQQMRGYGGMITFRVRGGEQAARTVAESTALFGLSVSLGGVESLISHPATMTHGSTAGTAQAPDRDLVRLSVGIEAVEDLVDDLQQTLAAVPLHHAGHVSSRE